LLLPNASAKPTWPRATCLGCLASPRIAFDVPHTNSAATTVTSRLSWAGGRLSVRVPEGAAAGQWLALDAHGRPLTAASAAAAEPADSSSSGRGGGGGGGGGALPAPFVTVQIPPGKQAGDSFVVQVATRETWTPASVAPVAHSRGGPRQPTPTSADSIRRGGGGGGGKLLLPRV
jgi:hypothetical protein